MLRVITPFSALFMSVAFLLMGFGLLGTLVPVRANLNGLSPGGIGLIGSGYYLGFALGCLLGPYFVARVGHIRAFAAFATVAAISALLFPLIENLHLWAVLRAMTGASMSGLSMVIESWLNERSTNNTRGRVFSFYTVINLTVITVGQLLLTTSDPRTDVLFSVAAILVCLGLLPVVLTTSSAPAPIKPVKLDLRGLYKLSPAGVIGCVCVGLANSVFWALGPVFAQYHHFSAAGVAGFVSLGAIGGAVMQWPIGRLSDRIDRRKVMILCCVMAAATGIGIALSDRLPSYFVFGFAFLFGGFAIPVYALSVAHTNDFVTGNNFVEISSGLLLVFGISAVIGPLIASQFAQYTTPSALFFFTAAVHVITAIIMTVRISRRVAIPVQERPSFVSATSTSPAAFSLDPRADAEHKPPS